MADHEISCQTPEHYSAHRHSYINSIYLQALIKINKLSSLATKKLSSVESFCQTPQGWIDTVKELNKKFEELQEKLRDDLELELPFDLKKSNKILTSHQALSIQFLYYALVWDIHTSLAHPWFRSILGLDRHLCFQDDIRNSTAIVAQTSRNAILDCRFIHIDASCTLP